MVNRAASGTPDDLLADVRDRALRDTDVSFVITDALTPGSPIVWVNEAFTRTTGYGPDEVRGRNPNLLHGHGTDRVEAARMAEAAAAGRAATVTVLNYRRDGTPFWNQVSISPVHDAAGTVTHWVGVQVDVTEQVRRAAAQEASIEVERRARAGLSLVAEVSDLLSDLDEPSVLREIAGLLREQVVDWAAFLVDDAGLRPASGIEPVFRESGTTRGRRPVDLVDGTPGDDPVQRLLDGTEQGPLEVPLDAEGVGPVTARLVAHVRLSLEGPEGAGGPRRPTSVVVHTVPGRRRSQGVLVTVPRGGGGLEALDAHDRTVLHLVVRRVGMAIDNVRLYAREHRLAETLQRAMLPEQAEVRGLDVWTYYAPSAGHAQVGGDWYDVLQVSEDQVAVVIGDVVGHDVEAAAAMGQLRSVVRAYAFDEGAPGAVLDRVDQLVAGMRITRSASLVLAMLARHPDDGGWSLRYSRAGHLPPILVRHGQVTQLAEAGGPMVGFGGAGRPTGETSLEPGDVVVFYTDGLIERRDRTLRDGLGALVDAAALVGATDAAGVGEELLARLADGPEDDVAVVVVRVPGPVTRPAGSPDAPAAATGVPRRRRWSMPSDSASIARARHAVTRTCEAWGLPDARAAELVVSELVANAVLHGWGHLALRLFDTGEGLRIEVEDANPAPPVTTEGHHGRVGGYGMQIVERLADWGWRPSGAGKVVWARVRPTPFGPGPDAAP
ncbi:MULTISPECIES: SpoIIE family protein phosphatase [unclassified Actinotalea]|uniref:SpoIIE family protein phosphatase n=1 Tax=unclassified Actinotalea TaxID=2638618 RepID=UPI0015F68377|nr:MULTISPECIES: SpoIIE family protein phosphatase [unclassified Actinotalea]